MAANVLAIETAGRDATEALGEALAPLLVAGDVLILSGDLGAGKTQLVKGLARGLGITEGVRSPTFLLVNIYAGGRLPLFHLDLYRLDTPEQIIAAGLEEYLRPDGVTVIEWAERWPDATSPHSTHHAPRNSPGPRLRRVQMDVLGENERRITYEDSSA